MGELVNLRRVRKRRDKDEASKLAEMNRTKFGLTKSERNSGAANTERAAKALDQHKLPRGKAT